MIVDLLCFYLLVFSLIFDLFSIVPSETTFAIFLQKCQEVRAIWNEKVPLFNT